MTCYDKAGEIGTFFCDELYCKANLYEDLGDYGKANSIYTQIAEILQKRGYDLEAQAAQKMAQECLEKCNK